MRQEEAIGIVTHYYSHLGVAVVQVNKGSLSTGNTIHIVGHSTDITETVASMEYEHQHVDQANAGQNVGIKIAGSAREHDIVYLVLMEADQALAENDILQFIWREIHCYLPAIEHPEPPYLKYESTN